MKDETLGNTIIVGQDLHKEYDRRLMNQYLREGLNSSKIGLGVLMGLARKLEYLAYISVRVNKIFDLFRYTAMDAQHIVELGSQWFGEFFLKYPRIAHSAKGKS
jgi:hypothetical protein